MTHQSKQGQGIARCLDMVEQVDSNGWKTVRRSQSSPGDRGKRSGMMSSRPLLRFLWRRISEFFFHSQIESRFGTRLRGNSRESKQVFISYSVKDATKAIKACTARGCGNHVLDRTSRRWRR